MSRQKYTDKDLGAFSDWHRERLIDPFRWIDIDYFGYQIVHGDYKPYVAIERIRLTDCEPQEGPSRYPIEPHKERVYRAIANRLEIPAYAMWHTDECQLFVLQRLDAEEPRKTLEGASELMDFLDEICEEKFGGLGYRW